MEPLVLVKYINLIYLWKIIRDSYLIMIKFNDTLLRVARGENVDHTQYVVYASSRASKPEYREFKQKYAFEEITIQPELWAYVTCLPFEQYDVDTAFFIKESVNCCLIVPNHSLPEKILAGDPYEEQ